MLRRVNDLHARRIAELDALLCQRERARDQRLRRDDRRRRGDDEQGPLERIGCQEIKRVACRGGLAQQQRALAKVVEQESREHGGEPRDANGPLAEMPHVGIQRLRTRHRQYHGAEGKKPGDAVVAKEQHTVPRIGRRQHARRRHDRADAECGDRHEPHQHDRPERRAYSGRPEPLHHEQREENDQRDRHHDVREGRVPDLESFHGAEHRNGRCDHAVSVQQRGAEQSEGDERESPTLVVGPALLLKQQRQQGEDSSLAPVVRTQNEHDVLDTDHQHQRPENQGKYAENVLWRWRDAVFLLEALTQGVQRARADVAIDDAECRE